MDWIIIILLILLLIHTEWRYRSLKRATHNDARAVYSLMTSRMGRIKSGLRSTQDPDVDFDPKTTTRDTGDIPATGRMGRGVRLSDGGDLHGTGDDNRLQSGTGSPTA